MVSIVPEAYVQAAHMLLVVQRLSSTNTYSLLSLEEMPRSSTPSMVREKQQEQLGFSRPLRSVKGWPLTDLLIRDQSLPLSRKEGKG